MVLVKYYGILAKVTNCKEEQFSASNLKNLLKQIKQKYGEDAYKYAKMSLILVNEIPAGNLQGYSTKLKASDVLQFLPVCGGG